MRIAAALAVLLLAGAAAPAPDDTGRFVVTRVLIDPALDNMQQRYVGDDPRLLGRFVQIAPHALLMDGGEACTQPARRWRRQTVAELLRATLSRRASYQAHHPRPADMGLTVVPAGPVNTVTYRCLGPDTGETGGIPGHVWTGATTFVLGPTRRGLLWDGEVVLLLAPAGTVAPPRPGFDCRKAILPAEQAICRDPALASWDRSVGRAFARLRDGDDDVAATDDPDALLRSQRRWIVERNRCGGNAGCLKDRMMERVYTLMDRQY